ncbi:MAG: restriction endonuclease subunit S [Dolichospermum sp.]
MNNWKDLYWGDLITLEYGKPCPNYADNIGEYPVFGTNGKIGQSKKALCNHPSVIIGRKGAYRGVHYSDKPFWVIDTAFYLEPKVDIDLKWAYYNLLTQDINGMDSGSAIPSTSRQDFYFLSVKLPPLSEQKAIAHILSSLDDKIELNRQMNETLEAMAKAIFKSWFVDFDPVSAKRSGRQPAGMDTATADLFPDEFEESSLGLIPKGWRVGKLGDLGKIVTGKTPSTKVAEYFGGNVPFITPSDMDGKKTISRTARYLTEDGVNAVKSAKIPAGSIMVSCIGSDMGKVACTVQDSVTNQQINSIIANDYSREYIYYNLSQRKEELQNLAGGGSAVPILNKGHFSNIEILIPDIYLLKQFDNFSNTFTKKIYENDEESHILATLRDTLLPKLMSGEIRVKEAEKIMEKLT